MENIPPREGRAVTVGGREIAIFNLEDRYLTIENQCPHKGGPLCDGIVSGTTVVCPLHGWRFDLETGMAVRASEPVVRRYVSDARRRRHHPRRFRRRPQRPGRSRRVVSLFCSSLHV